MAAQVKDIPCHSETSYNVWPRNIFVAHPSCWRNLLYLDTVQCDFWWSSQLSLDYPSYIFTTFWRIQHFIQSHTVFVLDKNSIKELWSSSYSFLHYPHHLFITDGRIWHFIKSHLSCFCTRPFNYERTLVPDLYLYSMNFMRFKLNCIQI